MLRPMSGQAPYNRTLARFRLAAVYLFLALLVGAFIVVKFVFGFAFTLIKWAVIAAVAFFVATFVLKKIGGGSDSG